MTWWANNGTSSRGLTEADLRAAFEEIKESSERQRQERAEIMRRNQAWLGQFPIHVREHPFIAYLASLDFLLIVHPRVKERVDQEVRRIVATYPEDSPEFRKECRAMIKTMLAGGLGAENLPRDPLTPGK